MQHLYSHDAPVAYFIVLVTHEQVNIISHHIVNVNFAACDIIKAENNLSGTRDFAYFTFIKLNFPRRYLQFMRYEEQI
jgi:hypothetical protein